MLAYEVVERQVLLPLVAACRRRWGDALAAVTLFGSWARGEQREFSEIDVLVVVDELPLGRWERQALVAAVTDDIDAELDELREREGYRLKELGDGLMQEATSRLETARRALAEADYAYTVRSAQEAVELSCKAVLMAAGVDAVCRRGLAE